MGGRATCLGTLGTMTSMRSGILRGLIGLALVACGRGDAQHVPPPTSAAAKAAKAPPSSSSAAVSGGVPDVVAPSYDRTFRPEDGGIDLSFGRFGHPCELENDRTTHVVMLQCGEVGAPAEAGITVNFYLPGIWHSEPLTAEHVATMIRDNAGPDSHVEAAFEVADRVMGQSVYFLTMSAIHAAADGGQAFIIKVAALKDAVYSVSYTRMFSGERELMRAQIREWLATHVTNYGREIGGLTPDRAWVGYLRSELQGVHRSR